MHDFDLNDFMRQVATIRQVGALKNALRRIPGLDKFVPPEALERLDKRQLRRSLAIVRAMTPAERREADLLDPSRIVRIANGSGTSLHEVSDVLGNFYRMRRALRGER